MSINIAPWTPPPSGYSGPGGAPAVTWNLFNSLDGKAWTNNGNSPSWNDIVVLYNSMVAQAPDRWWKVEDSNGALDEAHNYSPVKVSKYSVQKSPNASGLDWLTVDTISGLSAAKTSYDSYVAAGGYWQLVDESGTIIETNLAVEDRFKPGVQPGILKDIWSLEAFIGTAWTWLADSDTLAGARALLKQARAGTLATISEQYDLRITDKNGAVVYTDKGKVPVTVFWNVEQSPTTDMAKWVLKTGPYNTYGEAKAAFASIIQTEPIDILRIVDTKGNVYDKYAPKTGTEAGPLAAMTGLMIGVALIIALAGMRAVME